MLQFTAAKPIKKQFRQVEASSLQRNNEK